jgi:hypothetical protein
MRKANISTKFGTAFSQQIEFLSIEEKIVRFNILIMRVILGGFFAVVLTRIFYGKVEPLYIAGLAIFLAGMSYVTEYFRNKKRKKS